MASDKERFLVSRTYSVATPDDVEAGEPSEHGFDFEDVKMSLEETVKELERCVGTSNAPIRNADDCQVGTWAYTEGEANWRDGSVRDEAVHVKMINGSDCQPRNLFRLFKLARLLAR